MSICLKLVPEATEPSATMQVLKRVRSVEVVQGAFVLVHFETTLARAEAEQATGWPAWDPSTLRMLTDGSFVQTRTPEGTERYPRWVVSSAMGDEGGAF